MTLVFLPTSGFYEGSLRMLWFHAEDEGRLVRCGVTREALLWLAGRDDLSADLVAIYLEHIDRIRRAATRAYRRGTFAPDGAIVLDKGQV
jgi:hypothetical protein